MPTARFADMVISRLRLEKMEGGVVIAGRSFHTTSHCRVLLLVFAGCFLFAGVVLTILAYRPLTDSNTHYLRHLSGSQVAGPCLVVTGLLFFGVGLAMFIVSRRLSPPSSASPARRAGAKSARLLCFRRWWRPVAILSSVKRKRMIDDLMHHSSEIHYKVNFRDDDTFSVENRDVASFPDACFVNVHHQHHHGRAFKNHPSPIVKIKTIS